MQISLFTFLTQPPAETGAANNTGVEAPAGSPDFQAIMSQITGSNGNLPAGETAAPQLPWMLPAPPVPVVSPDMQPGQPAPDALASQVLAANPAAIEPKEKSELEISSSTPGQQEKLGTQDAPVATLAQALVADLMRLRAPDGTSEPTDAGGSASEPATQSVSSDGNTPSVKLQASRSLSASKAEVSGGNGVVTAAEVMPADNVSSAGLEFQSPSQKIPVKQVNPETTKQVSGEIEVAKPITLTQSRPDSADLQDGSTRISIPAATAANIRAPEPKVTSSNQVPAQMAVPPAETGSGFEAGRSEPLASATKVAGEFGSLNLSATGPYKEMGIPGLVSEAASDVSLPTAKAATTTIAVPRGEILSAEYTLSSEAAPSEGIPGKSLPDPTIQSTSDLTEASLGSISMPVTAGTDPEQIAVNPRSGDPNGLPLQEPASPKAQDQAPLNSSQPPKVDPAEAVTPQRSAPAAEEVAFVQELLSNAPLAAPPSDPASKTATAPANAKSEDQLQTTPQNRAPVTGAVPNQPDASAAGAEAIPVPTPTPPPMRGQGTGQMQARTQDNAPETSAAPQPSIIPTPGADAAPVPPQAGVHTMPQSALHQNVRVETDAPMQSSTSLSENGAETPGAKLKQIQPSSASQTEEVFAVAGDNSSPEAAPRIEVKGSVVQPEAKEAKTISVAGSSPKEVFKPADGAEAAESRTSTAQGTPNRSSDKVSVDQARPGKSEAAGNDKSVRESFAGLAIAPDVKSANVTKAAAAPPPKPAELFSQLSDRIQSQLQNGQGEVRIQLKPEHLGYLEIKAEIGAAGVVARITAESSSVKQYLESNIHTLQQSLQDQGLKVDRIDVVLQPGPDARQPGSHQQNPDQTGTGSQGSNTEGGNSGSRQDQPRRFEVAIDPTSDVVIGPNSTFHTIA